MAPSRRARWILLSLGIVTVVAMVDALTRGTVVLIALLSAGPLVASARLGPRPTAAVSIYAIALGLLLGVPHDMFGSEDHAVRVAVLAAICLVAVWAAELGERLRQSSEQLQVILENVADGVTAQGPDGKLVFANRAAADAVGLRSAREMLMAPRESVVGRFELYDEHDSPLPADRLPGRRAVRGEVPEPTVVRYRARDTGEERWSVVKATPIFDEAGDVVLAISVMEDVTERMRGERAARFLSQASVLLAASLDHETTLRRVAELAVPEMADWCSVEIEDGGRLRSVALSAADPDKLPLAQELRTDYPVEPDARTGIPNVLRTGRSELYSEIPEELIDQAARDPRHLELMRGLEPSSVMLVPMIARGRTLGVISFVSSRPERRFDQEDLALAEELGRRAAMAVDNARLYSERAYIARALQESLLPPTLPEVDGLEIAARFRAAGDGNEVGGDFYDVFDTGDEANWAVVMGDVCGKGASAAALTALARYTLRAAAMREGSPSHILGELNGALVRQRADEQFCTVAFARLEANGSAPRLTLASGGHPLPLLLRADGRVEAVGTPGTLLGVTAGPELSDESVQLGAGDAVVLYTDGLTDARAPTRILSPADLASVLRECAGLDASAIAERVERAATAPVGNGEVECEPRDDVAILVLRVREDAAGSS